jgi:hypothetical protein
MALFTDDEFERARDAFLARLAVYFADEIGIVANEYLEAADALGRGGLDD